MQTVHRKYRNHASRTILLPLLFATNGNVLAQSGWIAKNLQAGCAAIAQGVLPLLFGSDSPAAADPQMAITFDDLPAHGALPPGDTRVAVASKIIAALRDAHVPPSRKPSEIRFMPLTRSQPATGREHPRTGDGGAPNAASDASCSFRAA
jgi:hypothetical protein